MKLSETQELTMKMAKVGYESAAADGMTKFLASVGPVEVVDGD